MTRALRICLRRAGVSCGKPVFVLRRALLFSLFRSFIPFLQDSLSFSFFLSLLVPLSLRAFSVGWRKICVGISCMLTQSVPMVRTVYIWKKQSILIAVSKLISHYPISPPKFFRFLMIFPWAGYLCRTHLIASFGSELISRSKFTRKRIGRWPPCPPTCYPI